MEIHAPSVSDCFFNDDDDCLLDNLLQDFLANDNGYESQCDFDHNIHRASWSDGSERTRPKNSEENLGLATHKISILVLR